MDWIHNQLEQVTHAVKNMLTVDLSIEELDLIEQLFPLRF